MLTHSHTHTHKHTPQLPITQLSVSFMQVPLTAGGVSPIYGPCLEHGGVHDNTQSAYTSRYVYVYMYVCVCAYGVHENSLSGCYDYYEWTISITH